MNQTHLHLVITHLPIFGSILGVFVLAYGIWSRSNQTIIAASGLFIISSFGAGISYLTGEAAEDVVEKIPGVAKEIIEQHEDFAVFALIAFIISGIISIFEISLAFRNSPLTRPVAFITLIIALIGFGLVARTGYLGGQIRHTEVNAHPALQDKGGEHESEE